MKIKWKVLILSLIIVFLVSAFGSLFTDTGGWYEEIRPTITPPNYVFPIVWTILFILIALALYFVWVNADKRDKLKVGIVFGINLVANALWTYLYFGLRNPLYAFYDIIIILVSIIIMIMVSWKISKKAALLLIPYLLWVGFAAVLNYLSIK